MLETCPQCGAGDIQKKPVIEHTSCGCIRPQTSFDDGEYFCPECRSRGFAPDEIKEIAELYECLACSNRFDGSASTDNVARRDDLKPETKEFSSLLETAREDARKRAARDVPGNIQDFLVTWMRVLMPFTPSANVLGERK